MNAFLRTEHGVMELKAHQTDFLRKTRHEIRNALHVVVGMSKVLAISDTLTHQQKDIVATLKKNADLSLRLIDSTFDFLQKGTPSPQICPPQAQDAETYPCNQKSLMAQTALLTIPRKRHRALLVEDSVPNALIAASYLNKIGYGCDVAKNGQDALDKFFSSPYDIVIMDVQMPGMDGLEITRRIRAREKKINIRQTPILGTTGNATEDDRLFCTKAGMNDFIPKPFDLESLKEKLHGIMKQPSARLNKNVQ